MIESSVVIELLADIPLWCGSIWVEIFVLLHVPFLDAIEAFMNNALVVDDRFALVCIAISWERMLVSVM